MLGFELFASEAFQYLFYIVQKFIAGLVKFAVDNRNFMHEKSPQVLVSSLIGTVFGKNTPEFTAVLDFDPKVRYGSRENQQENSPVDGGRGDRADYNAAKDFQILDLAVDNLDHGVDAVVERSLKLVLKFWIFVLSDIKRPAFLEGDNFKQVLYFQKKVPVQKGHNVSEDGWHGGQNGKPNQG